MAIEHKLRFEPELRKLGPEGLVQMLREQIATQLQVAREHVVPKYAGIPIILYESGRVSRTFNNEHARLWQTAVGNCVALTEGLLDLPLAGEQLRECIRATVETVVVPFLEQQSHPGEDLLMLLNERTTPSLREHAVKMIAARRITPFQESTGVWAALGLLIQARRVHHVGDVQQAYSFLIDASRVIGQYNGARFTMDLLDEVVPKRRAHINGAVPLKTTGSLKMRVGRLYYDLRPAEGWPDRKTASNTVWLNLNPGRSTGKKPTAIAKSTVDKMCHRLFENERTDGAGDVRVNVEMYEQLPNGTLIKSVD